MVIKGGIGEAALARDAPYGRGFKTSAGKSFQCDIEDSSPGGVALALGRSWEV